ncbi:class I SAM-dependent methyltransferase [Sediminicoccus sp. KRV36]|uniref:class I SAM-dependent DNA methyltransferase n=1 Tax=Sediminicoccus sp. KRV36 TaxID=3133721 RepID=UPI00200F7987|nr:class I SAM-dependent methyltransferase [Sediminicoccus rosea]UPY37916.1 class I SAM-dependent methyltransferase [Sediminicoccus rosea]
MTSSRLIRRPAISATAARATRPDRDALDSRAGFAAIMRRMDPIARDYDALAPAYARALSDELTHKPMDRAWLTDFASRMAGRGLGEGAGRGLVDDAGRGLVGDLGCGPGHVTAFLASAGARMLGLDISAGMIAEARAAHPGLDFEVVDLRELAARPARFSGLVAMYSLIHLTPGELPQALAACRVALRPGGEFRAAVHLGEGVLRPEALWGVPISLGFRLMAEGELEAALTAAGFEVTESLTRAPYPEVEYPSRRCYVTARA